MIRNRKRRSSGKYKPKLLSKGILLVVAFTISSFAFAIVGANIASMLKVATANAIALIQQEIAEASAAISHMTASIGSFSSSTVANIYNNSNSLTSALKVATAQSAQSSQTLAETQTLAAQKSATARQTIQMQDLLLKTVRAYGPTGQGYKACVVVHQNQGLDAAQTQTAIVAASKETETLSAISVKSDLNNTIYDRAKVAELEFCGVGSTFCTPSTLPGGSVNAALLFTPTTEGSKEQLARTMLRENIVGVDIQGLKTNAQIESPLGQKSFFDANRQSALLSPAAYSLAYIDAQNTKTIERDGTKYSANELIDKTVGRYYGGSEAKEWQASMITQEPRGLLVEAARLGGLSVWLSNHSYQQNLRKEANLAAILIATASPLTEQVRQLGNKADSRAIISTTSLYK